MFQRVHVQILDNPIEEVFFESDEFDKPITNKLIADELQKEMKSQYPLSVSVEYIDMFLDDDMEFPEIKRLLRQGAIKTPVILINGIPKIHGGIPASIIKKEVEKLLFSGPVH